MRLLKIEKAQNPNKRLRATFSDGTITEFGTKNGNTFIDHKNTNLKKNYIARHSKLNENWNDPTTAGALSRYILWEKENIKDSISEFKKKFNI